MIAREIKNLEKTERELRELREARFLYIYIILYDSYRQNDKYYQIPPLTGSIYIYLYIDFT